MKVRRVVATLFLFFAVQYMFAAKGGKFPFPEIDPGETIRGKVEISLDYSSYDTYTIRVPVDAFAIRLSINESPADLDLFIKKGEEIRDYKDVDAYSESEDYNEVIFITRFSNPPLESGRYFIDVTYRRSGFPEAGGKRMGVVPYTITYEVLRAEPSAKLSPGKAYSSELLPKDGMFKVFRLDVPDHVEDLRIDVFNAEGDIDLFVRKDGPPLGYDNADYIGESLLGNEQLLIRRHSSGSIPRGTYYILVIDQLSKGKASPFSIVATFSADPPEELMGIPYPPDPAGDIEKAIMATVEVIAEAGKGSGCLVSPDGLILTNWHVIQGFSGEVSANLYIAMTFSTDEPPRELFKAEVLETDRERDFALLKITSGLYGQPLPRRYEFPYFTLGKPGQVEIGQPISIIGFPSTGGTGSRVSVSLTRGIISGFEKGEFGTFFKTDGKIIGGSSGGAACNVYYELIGLPTIIINEDTGNMGLIYPISMLPESWLGIISAFR